MGAQAWGKEPLGIAGMNRAPSSTPKVPGLGTEDHTLPAGGFDLAAALTLLTESLPFDPETFDLATVPPGPGVFLVETAGEPFLGKSASLRRRLARLLGPSDPGKLTEAGPSAGAAPQATEAQTSGLEPRASSLKPRLNLRAAARAIHWRTTGSAFETSLLLYQAARALFPSGYRQRLRLRVPALLKLNLHNPFPRCYVTRRLGRGPAVASHSSAGTGCAGSA